MSLFKTTKNPALTLKSMPPRIVKGFLDRKRLHFESGNIITALSAPTGYGKTSQLSQWRRDVLAQGFLAFWYSADERDEPLRFIHGLTRSAQMSCGNHGFMPPFSEWIEDQTKPDVAIAGWLAEVATLSVNVLLLLDDLDLLPAETRNQLLPYLMGNIPPNLHIAIASRDPRIVTRLGTHLPGAITRLALPDMRFQTNETIDVLSIVLGKQSSPELGIRIHELTEGWPLGVKLAAASLNRGDKIDLLPSNALVDLQSYFAETVINRLPDKQVNQLVHLSQFDLIHQDLCRSILGFDLEGRDLRRLQEEVPLLISSEGNDEWSRLHPMARNMLHKRLELLPLKERQAVSRKAVDWYSERQLFEEASKHSLIVGDTAKAIELVQKNALEMTTEGRNNAILSWFERMSPDEQLQHPGFWWPAAWALAMSDRHEEAYPITELILSKPDLTELDKFDVALIRSAAAGYADKVDLIDKALSPWKPPLPGPLRLGSNKVYAVGRSYVALFNGQVDEARNLIGQVGNTTTEQAYAPVPHANVASAIGLSYLWEGRFALAEQTLKPAFNRSTSDLGRRHAMTCSIAALLAETSWELGNDEEPKILLAGRLNVIDRYCLPESILSTYKTLARIANHQGQQDHALTLLESLSALGKRRSLIRLDVLAHYELVLLHAQHGRLSTATNLYDELNTLVEIACESEAVAMCDWLNLHKHLAYSHLQLASGERKPSLDSITPIRTAMSIAKKLMRTRDLIEAQLILSELLMRRGDDHNQAQTTKEEALSLARAKNMTRLLREQTNQTESKPEATKLGQQPNQADKLPAQISESAFLTPKEREVLSLLCENFSNKEIARAMGISVETVKWHMKNLFSKLNALNRKHVVARAKMLGIL